MQERSCPPSWKERNGEERWCKAPLYSARRWGASPRCCSPAAGCGGQAATGWEKQQLRGWALAGGLSRGEVLPHKVKVVTECDETISSVSQLEKSWGGPGCPGRGLLGARRESRWHWWAPGRADVIYQGWLHSRSALLCSSCLLLSRPAGFLHSFLVLPCFSCPLPQLHLTQGHDKPDPGKPTAHFRFSRVGLRWC